MPAGHSSTVQRRNILLTQCARISDMEVKIGAGLIEEVIAVAEGELKLLDIMRESRAYVPFSLRQSHSSPLGRTDLFAGGRNWRRKRPLANGNILGEILIRRELRLLPANEISLDAPRRSQIRRLSPTVRLCPPFRYLPWRG